MTTRMPVNSRRSKWPGTDTSDQALGETSKSLEVEGFKYILTTIDRATRYPIAVPLKSTEATEVWRSFKDNWIGTFGVPTLLIYDRGAQFTSNYWAEQCQMFGIRSETTPAYHP